MSHLVPVPSGRVPPHSLDAERSVLGGLLLETGVDKNAALDDLLSVLKPDDFYREAHRKIFEAAIALHAKGEPVDRVTLKDALRAAGALDAVGGESTIDLLDTVVPNASNLKHYGVIIHEKALARRLIEAAHSIATEGYEGTGSVGELLDRAETRIMAVTEVKAQANEARSIRDMMKVAFKALEDRHANQSESGIVGVASGLESLDRLTRGFRPGNLIVIAARPSMGKTSLLLRMLEHVSADVGCGAGMFSMEQSCEEVTDRMLSSRARVSGDSIATGKMLDSDWSKLARAAGELAVAPLLIDDTPGLSLLELRARARRMARRFAKEGKPLAFIGIDYLQLMRTTGEADTRDQAIGELTRGLKALAKELGIPVVVLSQLNRAVEKRPDKRPVMSDLRESGNIEQDSDLILFVYRHEVYETDQQKLEACRGLADVIIAKQRNGGAGTAEMAFIGEFTRFENLAHGYQRSGRDNAAGSDQ